MKKIRSGLCIIALAALMVGLIPIAAFAQGDGPYPPMPIPDWAGKVVQEDGPCPPIPIPD